MACPQVLGPNGEIYEPTILPQVNFNPEADCQVIEKAMKGAGTDEKALISVLCKRTAEERAQIARCYKGLYGKDLIKQIKSETSGDFGKLMRYLCLDRAMLRAKIVYDSVQGVGTDEQALIEVICSATNTEMEEMKVAYRKVLEYKGKDANRRTLEKDVENDTSGYLKRLFIALIQATRKEPTPDEFTRAKNHGVDCLIDFAAAKASAQTLYDAGEGKLGTDESTFIQILGHSSVWQLAAIEQNYLQLSKKTLREAVKSETSGDFCTAMTSTLDFALNRPAAFAHHLHKAMKGLGTREGTLTRILVSRSDVDMKEIKTSYEKQFGKSLAQDIKGDTSGDYKNALLALIGEY